MTELDFTLERDASGCLLCPCDGCDADFENHIAVVKHHSMSHVPLLVVDIVGEDAWREYLREEHVAKGRSAAEIIRDLPAHTGKQAVRDSLTRFGFYHHTSPGPSHSVSRILALRDVTTIEEAREEAQRRREAQP